MTYTFSKLILVTRRTGRKYRCYACGREILRGPVVEETTRIPDIGNRPSWEAKRRYHEPCLVVYAAKLKKFLTSLS